MLKVMVMLIQVNKYRVRLRQVRVRLIPVMLSSFRQAWAASGQSSRACSDKHISTNERSVTDSQAPVNKACSGELR